MKPANPSLLPESVFDANHPLRSALESAALVEDGLTLRDVFAAFAAVGNLFQAPPARVAVRAYEVADEMLRVRAATGQGETADGSGAGSTGETVSPVVGAR